MSQTKAQLVAPIGVVTASGIVASGVITASSFDGNVVGTATSIISGENITVGVMSATGFSGDFTGTATGITTGSDIKVGAFTASSFAGDFTGTATSMMRGTGFEAGAVNATGFVANVVGDVTGNTTGLAGSVTSGGNIHVGVMTATSYSGDGSNLTGIAATNFNTQTVTANAAETIIDLADGNVITMNQSANTTVGFASTSTAMDITIIRIKDANTTARTITWPSTVNWNGGSAPTLVDSNPSGEEFNQIRFMTRDEGATWYGWESATNNRIDNTLWSWGYGGQGGLAHNNRTSYSSPTQVSGTTWTGVGGVNAEGEGGMITTKTDGTLWAWGSNQGGFMGQNNRTAKSSPCQIPGTTWALVSLTTTSVWATKTDGTAWTWGYNNKGLLGLNSMEDNPGKNSFSSPVQVGTDATWSTSGDRKLMLGAGVAGAIKADGTLWMCGEFSDGRLGLNDEVSRSSPTQVPGTTWSKISNQAANPLASKTDGTLWAWGANFAGQLGQNQSGGNPARYSSPKQVGTDTTWTGDICSGVVGGAFASSYGVKTDGSLWSWGYNEQGQLGQNDRTQRSSPVQIPGTTWNKISFARGTLLTIKTDGTLWSWGYNYTGKLGLNQSEATIPHISSPAQVGTDTNWNKLLHNAGYSVAATQQA